MTSLIPITPELVLRAYAAGVFPMARTHEGTELLWIDPHERGILPFESFHLPRSLRKVLRRGTFQVRCNTAFAQVISHCAEITERRKETWINEEITELFTALHEMGHAHSVETWRDGVLVGGLYGVAMGGAFFGESMFSRATDASKVALCHLVASLQTGGFVLLDTQFITEHLSHFGVVEISREEYHERLSHALTVGAAFHCVGDGTVVSDLLTHSSTQTS